MVEPVTFRNYDDISIYRDAQDKALDPYSKNFVVEFGQNTSRIAFDLGEGDIENLLAEHDRKIPVRWINIWAPNIQIGIIELLAKNYGFSRRLTAILSSAPTQVKRSDTEIEAGFDRFDGKLVHQDVENANIEMQSKIHQFNASTKSEEKSHYTIASNLTNYQSVDVGKKFLCLGANWIHPLNPPSGGRDGVEEQKSRRLWSWLVLCYDGTVISIHEDLGQKNPPRADIKAMRAHTLTVLSQLSKEGYAEAGSVSIVSVRQSLHDGESGVRDEGAGNLFYYLFDDWNATFVLIITMKKKLEELSKDILAGLTRQKSTATAAIIIKSLYKIGKELKMNQHLYGGYKNLIKRVLEHRDTGLIHAYPSGREDGNHTDNRITIARSASDRFERLGDRIQLLVLSSIEEALSEKDALISTYFNITAQKDYQATAKLSYNATVLSKLGVLFLPVSLMTSYFSVQIDDLQGVYTSTTYWATFAIILSLSIFGLFFFSSWLIGFMTAVKLRIGDFIIWCRSLRRPGVTRDRQDRQDMHDNEMDEL